MHCGVDMRCNWLSLQLSRTTHPETQHCHRPSLVTYLSWKGCMHLVLSVTPLLVSEGVSSTSLWSPNSLCRQHMHRCRALSMTYGSDRPWACRLSFYFWTFRRWPASEAAPCPCVEYVLAIGVAELESIAQCQRSWFSATLLGYADLLKHAHSNR